MYDVAVVGKGLFGAATFRHLCRSGARSIVIGPDEPSAMPGSGEFAGPHGAHFDEARIIVARGDVPAVALTNLALEGMGRMETEIGTPLVVACGALEVTVAGSGPAELDDGVVAIPGDAIRIEERPPQGYFNPRAYIRAALSASMKHGGEVLAETVTNLAADGDSYRLRTDVGSAVSARKVVVAAGAWSNRLLARPLALRLKREYVLFARLSRSVAESIVMRPTVIHGLTGRVEGIYTLPPLRYPDGHWYLKLGANTLHDRMVDQEGIDEWYQRGNSDAALPDLVAAFRTVFPTVATEAFHTERCVITYTTHGRPYIDSLDSHGLFVATGGNGHGASWADGAGALAARLVAGRQWPILRREDFAVAYADGDAGWTEPLLMSERRLLS